MTKQSSKKNKTKSYEKPAIKNYGSIKDHTKAITGATGMDGGVAPSNRTMTCVSLPPFIQEHNWLLNDQTTQEKFRTAIFAKVKPGDVVLDLGTGTGLHALFAAQAGAKKVYAVDSEPIIEFAKLVAQKNNLSDKITFLQADSDRLELPEKVDVIITNIGFFNTLKHFPQAIEKHLKPQGQVIPERIDMEFSLLEDGDFYQKNITTWDQQKFNADFSTLKECALSRPLYGNWGLENILAPTQKLGNTEFKQETKFSVSFAGSVPCDRDGAVHGLLGWYTFQLTKDISFSTKPPLQLSPQIWNQWFLPATSPICVKKGDVLPVELRMNTSERFPEPVWQWTIGNHSTRSNFDTFLFTKLPTTEDLSPEL